MTISTKTADVDKLAAAVANMAEVMQNQLFMAKQVRETNARAAREDAALIKLTKEKADALAATAAIESKYEAVRHRSGKRLKKIRESDIDGVIKYDNIYGKFYEKLTSQAEDVTIFGQHAGTMRKVMYGFLPRGMFRTMNKFSAGLRYMDINLRKVKDSTEDGKEEIGSFRKAYDKIGKMTSLTKLSALNTEQKGLKVQGKYHSAISASANSGRSGGIGSNARMMPDYNEQTSIDKFKQSKIKRTEKIKEAGNLLTAGIFRKENLLARKEKRKDQFNNMKKAFKNFEFFEMAKNIGTVILRSSIFFVQMALLAILTIGGAYMLLKAFGPQIKAAWAVAWPMLKLAFSLVWEGMVTIYEGVLLIWKGFFGDGDFGDALSGIGKLLLGAGQVVLGLLAAVWIPLLTFLGGMLVETGIIIIDWLKSKWQELLNGDLSTKIKLIAKAIIAVVAVIIAIKLAILGMPILIAIALGVIIYRFGAWLVNFIPGFATGGVSSGGMAIVGERGPELIRLPKGSRIHSNEQSKGMVRNSGGDINTSITINASALTTDGEIKRITEKISKTINANIQRKIGNSTMYQI
tara:strand:- start:14615 stop:16345 length:1731 start_codon:yes stop_codon:yes gene_type:complete